MALPGFRPPRPGFMSYPAAPETELEFHEVASALFRRRYFILGLSLLGLLGGLFIALTSKQSYRATATVEFAQPNTHALGLDDPSYNASDLSTLELLNTELKTEQSEITNEGTALAVIQRLGLDREEPYALPAELGKRDPLNRERGLPLEQAPFERERLIKLFERNLSVDVVKGTRLLNVTFTDDNPERAAAIANAVVAASMEQTSGRHSMAFSQVSSWLTDQLTSLKQRVEDSQKRVEEYEAENQTDLAGMTIAGAGSVELSGRPEAPVASASVPVSRLLALNNELTNAQVARIAKEAINRLAQTGDPEAVLSIGNSSLVTGLDADSSFAPGNGGLALLQRLREQQVQLSVGSATAATKYGAKNPVMIEYQRQQAEVEAQITVELHRIRGRAQNDVDLAVHAEEGLRQQVTQQQGEVSQWTTKADHLLLLQGEAASSRALYQDLFAKLEESQFAAGIRASRVTVLDPARAPSSPSSPQKRMDVALGLLIGVVLGFIVALLVELLDDSLHSEEQVRKIFGAPVLGAIPRFPRGAKDAKAWVVRDPNSPISEAYRSFRTATFTTRAQGHCKTLLIASPRPGEGKATTCLNAAAALAVQGHRVLILNADMRRTSAAALPETNSSEGLSSYLASGTCEMAAIQAVEGLENLFLLPAGPLPKNPSELLSSSRFAHLVADLKHQFDYILIDSPPALLFSDTRILSSCVDGYVLVVQASATPKKDLRKALDTLYGSAAPFLGIVFNASKVKPPRYAKFGYGT